MAIYEDTYVSNDDSFLTAGADFVTKGLPAMVVSAGYGMLNTGVALGNAFGGNFEQRSAIKDLASTGSYGTEIAEYYKNHETMVDTGGIIVSSIIPGTAAVKALRYGQTALANVAARQSAGLITKTSSKLVASPANHINKLTAQIKAGQNTLTEVSRMRVFGGQLRQATLESAVFETAAILTNNQNSVLNAENLDYFDAIAENLDTLAFGTVLGGSFGAALGHFTDMGKLKKAAFEVETSERGLNRAGALAGNEVVPNANRGNNLVTTAKSFREGNATVAAVDGVEAIALNTQLARAEHNKSIQLKEQFADLMPTMNPKDKEYSKLANAAVDSTPSAVIDDLHLIGIDRDLSADEFAKAFGGLERIDYAGKPIASKGEESVKSIFTDLMKSFESRTEMAMVGRTETALERSYYADRNARLQAKADKKVKDATKLKTMAEGDTIASVGTMLRNITSKVNKPSEHASLTDDHIVGLVGYGGRTNIAEALDNTAIGLTYKKELMDVVASAFPDLKAALNIDSKMTAIARGGILESYKFSRTEDLLELALKAAKASSQTPALLKANPKFAKLFEDEAITSRYLETSLFFNTRSRQFSTQPMGMRAADIAPIGFLAGNRMQWGIAGKNIISDFKGVTPVELIAGKKTQEEITAQWAYSLHSSGFNLERQMRKGVNMTDMDLPYMERLHKELSSINPDEAKKLFELNPVVVVTSDAAGKATALKSITDLDELTRTLAASKREALIRLMEHNEGTKSLALEDMVELLNVSEEFVMSTGRQLIGYTRQNANYLKTENLRMTYAASDPTRAFSVGQGIARVERELSARRAELGEFTAGHLDAYNSLLPKNALQRNSKFNPADDITSAAESQGLLNATQARTAGEAFMQKIGMAVKRMETDYIDKVQTRLGSLGRLVKGDADAVAELTTVNRKLAQGHYGIISQRELNDISGQSEALDDLIADALGKSQVDDIILVPSELIAAIRGGEELTDSLVAKVFTFGDVSLGAFNVRNKNVKNFLVARNEIHSEFVTRRNNYNRQVGDTYDWNINTLPAELPRLDELQHIAQVEFPTGNSFGTPKGWIIARTAEELQAKINTAQRNLSGVKITELAQIKHDAKVLGDYDYRLDLTSNYAHSDMRKFGIQWDVLPESTPRIVDDIIQSTIDRTLRLDKSVIRQHYLEEFTQLERGNLAVNPAAKDAANDLVTAQQKTINAALGLKNLQEYKKLRTVQELMGEGLNKLASATAGLRYELGQAYAKARGNKVDEAWKALELHGEHYNLPKVYKGEEDYIMSTSHVSRNVAESLVARLNSVTSWLMLRADQVQGMVNVLSTPITSFAAIRELKTMIGDEHFLSIMNKESGIKLDGAMFESSMKAHSTSIKEFFANKELVESFRNRGLTSSRFMELRNAMDELGIVGASGDATKIGAFADKMGRAVTYLSDSSEEFTRFVVGRTAERVIESAAGKLPAMQAAKLLDMKDSLINSVITKTHGNYIAAQRPTLFQGWGGQAIGLFQTYQFNLMQALTRHIERGDRKAAMMMAGFQGSIFGAQGLPGFQLINDHIAQQGNTYGDIYSTAQNSPGKELSHLFLYGAASSATLPFGTGVNFYSRGDLTPRSPILIPTSVGEIPMVSFFSKLMQSGANAVNNFGTASTSATFAQFVAHNGFNRPLAGMAQLMMGQKTTANGTTLLSFDELDNRVLHTIAKIAGTTTTDESIISDAFYRAKSYQSARQAELDRLGMGVKTAIRGGGDFDVGRIMQDYIESGGDGANFDRWYQHQISQVNEGSFQSLRAKLNSPEGQYLQRIMD